MHRVRDHLVADADRPAGPTASGPTAVTTPATSSPTGNGRRAGSAPIAPEMILWSNGLMPAAFTAITTSPGPGCGTSASTTDRTSGPPNAVATILVAMSRATPAVERRFPPGAPALGMQPQ